MKVVDFACRNYAGLWLCLGFGTGSTAPWYGIRYDAGMAQVDPRWMLSNSTWRRMLSWWLPTNYLPQFTDLVVPEKFIFAC